jgi:hypothetical protein
MSLDIGNIGYSIDANVDLMYSIQIQNSLPINFDIIFYVFCLIYWEMKIKIKR